MLQYSAVGTRDAVRDYLTEFQETAQADELMISPLASSHAECLQGIDILADAWELTAAD